MTVSRPEGPFRELRVVTSVRWLPQELASAGIIPVEGDLGLDVPADTTGTAWWCSGAFAARLAATGVRPALLGPPAPWQASFGEAVLGREVLALPLREVTHRFDIRRPAFAKLADVKVAAVPAQWWGHLEDFLAAADEVGLAASTPVLVTLTRMAFEREYRCFVTGGQVVAASLYRDGEVTWDAWETGTQPPAGHAVGFAEDVLRQLPTQPPGWVLDVGQTREGDWAVVEANPAWCTNPYHCEPAGVVRTVLAAQDPDPAHRRWLWNPGAYLSSRARPLVVRD